MMNCEQHDYIEIVCMHQYPIQLTMKSGEIILGKAIDTSYNEAREECIKMNVDNHISLVNLMFIQKLEVCINNPHFQVVTFD